MFVLARAVTYSVLFIGLLLVFLPDRILASTGIMRPAELILGAWQVAGMLLGACGAALALTSILTFVVVTHVFVVLYEEPTLRRTFAGDYEAYCRRVGRWWPKR